MYSDVSYSSVMCVFLVIFFLNGGFLMGWLCYREDVGLMGCGVGFYRLALLGAYDVGIQSNIAKLLDKACEDVPKGTATTTLMFKPTT